MAEGNGKTPRRGPDGHYLVEITDVLQYYLPTTTWQQWSDTDKHSPAYYEREIKRHYYKLVILSFGQTPAADYAIGLALSSAGGYIQVALVHSGNTTFYVWEYLGLV